MRPLHLRSILWTILEHISEEFEASEAMCCDKRHQVAEKQCIPDLGFFFNVPELPSPYSIIYIIFATSQLPRPQNSRVHCNVLSEYIQVTS